MANESSFRTYLDEYERQAEEIKLKYMNAAADLAGKSDSSLYNAEHFTFAFYGAKHSKDIDNQMLSFTQNHSTDDVFRLVTRPESPQQALQLFSLGVTTGTVRPRFHVEATPSKCVKFGTRYDGKILIPALRIDVDLFAPDAAMSEVSETEVAIWSVSRESIYAKTHHTSKQYDRILWNRDITSDWQAYGYQTENLRNTTVTVHEAKMVFDAFRAERLMAARPA